MSKIINSLSTRKIVDTDLKNIYGELIEAFESQDCDTLHECLGEDALFDEALQELHPEDFEDL